MNSTEKTQIIKAFNTPEFQAKIALERKAIEKRHEIMSLFIAYGKSLGLSYTEIKRTARAVYDFINREDLK